MKKLLSMCMALMLLMGCVAAAEIAVDDTGAAPAGTAAAEIPAVLSGVAPAAFEKQWMLTKMRMRGLELPAAQVGAAMMFMLSEGAGIFGMLRDGQPMYAEITYNVYEQEGVGTVLDLIVIHPQTGESSRLLSLNMLADNTLVFNSAAEGQTVTYIFEEFTEEAAE